MQAKVPWMSKFISGPRDPVSNPHSVFCHVCQSSISIKGKGHHDIVRHWRREKHFRKEQRYRDQHGMAVLDRKKNILTGHRLERERELFDHTEDFEIGVRFPFYNAEASSASELVDNSSQQLKLQLECVYDLIGNGQLLSTFRPVWRILMAHLPENDLTSGINFSEERVVGLTQFLFNSLVKTLRDLVGTDEQYGLVFEDVMGERRLHLSFWQNESLVTLLLFTCDKLEGGDHMDLVICLVCCLH